MLALLAVAAMAVGSSSRVRRDRARDHAAAAGEADDAGRPARAAHDPRDPLQGARARDADARRRQARDQAACSRTAPGRSRPRSRSSCFRAGPSRSGRSARRGAAPCASCRGRTAASPRRAYPGTIAGMEFETRAIHDGQEPDPATGAIITPIYQTATFVQDAVGVNKGYDYARVANPTRTALQVALASLENAEHGIAFSSGLGATTTLMHLVNPGERVVLIADVYGGVYRMTSQVYEPKGYLFDYVPAAEFPNLADRLDENTRMVWVETPSNPMLNLVDIRGGRRRRARGRRDPRRRQHLRDPVPPESARPRRRRRAPLDDEVPRRPLRRRRRLLRHERPDDRGAPLLPAEVARRRARPVRLVARAARDQDARRADAAALRERARDRRVARRAAWRSSRCCTPASRRIPATRSRSGRCATSAG